MSNRPVKDSLVVFKEGARVNFRMYGHVSPVFGANIDGVPMLHPVIFNNRNDKEKFRQEILELIRADKLKEFMFIAECWMADVTDPERVVEHLAKHGSLQSFPGRREAVQVMYSSPEEEICYTAAIDRGTNMGGIASLGEWVESVVERQSVLPLAARFQNLFAQARAGDN